jgi:uncharacterized membrane protein
MTAWFYYGLFSMVGYGVGPLLAKKLTERTNPLQGVFLTNLAVVAICALAAASEGPLRAPAPLSWGILLLGGMTGAIAILSLFKGIEAGQISVVAPVANSFPIITWGLSLSFLHLSFNMVSLLCTLLIVAGVIILVYQKRAGVRWNRSAMFGVVTALGWGAHAFFIYILMSTGLPPFTTSFYLESAILVWLMVFLSLRQGIRWNVRLIWPYGIFCGLMTALGALMYTLAVSAGGNPEWIATIVGANPVLTALLAVMLFKEKLNPQQIAGVALTLVGLFALNLTALL